MAGSGTQNRIFGYVGSLMIFQSFIVLSAFDKSSHMAKNDKILGQLALIPFLNTLASLIAVHALYMPFCR